MAETAQTESVAKTPKSEPATTNAQVAQRFSELADYLEILGENEFKIRAYRNAVRALENLTEPVATIAAENRLDEIAGFGEAIKAKTKDILATGTTKALEEARAKVPPTARELIGLPGIGAKTVQQLFAALRVDSLNSLEKAIEEQRVRTIKGMSDETEVKLKEAIGRRRRHTKRMLISEALEIGDALINRLAKRDEVIDIRQTGSARRGLDTVGDIDLVATSTDPAATMEAFTCMPQVDTVIVRGENTTRVMLAKGFEADLKLGAPGEFGALLHHFTGSKAHSIRLREIAESKGLKINEYGVFRANGENLAAGDDEMAVYAALGLPPIPVELREDRGEIEAAQNGKLPRLVEVADICGDMHVHTNASDGFGSLEGMIITAKRRGYAYMAITDHSQSLVVANGLTPERLREQVKLVREASQKYEFPVFTGTECDIKPDGTMDFPDDILAELDFVIGSVHSRFNQTEEEMTERIIRAIENPNVDLIAHPTGRLLNERDPYSLNIEAVIEAAVRTGTALEINSFPDRLDLNDVDARMAKEHGAKIMIDTDSHAPSHFGVIRYGVTVARRAWLEPKDVLNTLSLEEMTAWLRRDK